MGGQSLVLSSSCLLVPILGFKSNAEAFWVEIHHVEKRNRFYFLDRFGANEVPSSSIGVPMRIGDECEVVRVGERWRERALND